MCGSKHAKTTSTVSIPPEVLARYNAVNARAETAANAPYKAFGNTASDYVAQMNAQQNAGIDDINATAGSYIPYMDKATAATTAGMGPAYEGIDRYMSPYIKDVADTTGALMKQQYEQAQSGALGTAASSGAFGGDRAGIAAANLQQQNQLGYGSTMAGIYNQGYTQALGASQADLARQLQGGAQMAGLGAQSQQLGLQGAQAKIAAGTMQQQTEQAGKDAMINRFMQEQGYPFQVAQFLANIAMGTGAASGSSTTTTTPRNIFGFAQGGGVSGPRTYSQGSIGGSGYVPLGDLPVGQLMVADPPQQQDNGKGIEDVIKLIATMGAARGGAIDQRHGYALDGTVLGPNTEEMLRQRQIRDLIPGLALADRKRSEANTAAAMGQTYENPANIGLSGHMSPDIIMPNAVPPVTPRTTPLPVGPEEEFDIPVRSGQTEARGIPVRSGPTGLDTPIRSGQTFMNVARSGPTGLDTPVRSGQTETDARGMPIRSGLVPFAFSAQPPMGGPGTYAASGMPFSELASMRPPQRPYGLGYEPTMPIGGPGTVPSTGLGGRDTRDFGTVGGNPLYRNGVHPGQTLADVQPVSPYRTAVSPAGAAEVSADTMTTLGHPAALVAPLANVAAPSVHTMFTQGIAPIEGGLDKNGNPLTSSAGAFGYSQMLPSTGPEAAGYAGLPWDEHKFYTDNNYNAALGEAYFGHLLKEFGDPVKAAAAYNAGGGRLASAIDRATALGGSWLDYMPAETQAYAKKFADRVGQPAPAMSDGLGAARTAATPDMTAAPNRTGGLSGADMTQQRDGLFNNNKPYDQRNMIGKFFHNEDGSLNGNAIMSLLSGIGSATQAQTISPIGAILAGIAGGSDTYKGLLKQSADIAQTQALTRETDVRADVSSFFSAIPGSDGFPLVRVGPGRMITLTEYLKNPVAFSTGDPTRDAAIQKEAERISGTSGGGGGAAAPEAAPANAGVRWTSVSNDAIAAAKAKLEARPGDFSSNDKAAREVMDGASAERSAALAGKPNSNELAFTVGSAIADNNMGTAKGYLSNSVLPVINGLLRTINPSLEITDADSQAKVLEKLAALNGASMTPDQQRAASVYRDFVNISPDMKMTPEAGATITSGIMSQNQDAIDRANYYSYFMSKAGSGVSMADVDAAYAQEYGQMHQMEKDSLRQLFMMAQDPQKGPTVKKFLDAMNAGTANQEDAQAVLQYLLGDQTPPLLARYFIKGM